MVPRKTADHIIITPFIQFGLFVCDRVDAARFGNNMVLDRWTLLDLADDKDCMLLFSHAKLMSYMRGRYIILMHVLCRTRPSAIRVKGILTRSTNSCYSLVPAYFPTHASPLRAPRRYNKPFFNSHSDI